MRLAFPTLLILSALGAWLAVHSAGQLPILAEPPTLSEASRAHLADFSMHFGADDILLVTLVDRGDNPLFNEVALGHLRDLTQRLEASPEVAQVVSLTNLEDFKVLRGFGRVLPLPPERLLPATGGISQARAAELRSDPFLRTGMLAGDGRTAALWVLLHPELRDAQDRIPRIQRLLDSIPRQFDGAPDLSVAATGFPALHGLLRTLQWDHALRVGPLVLLGIVLVGLLLRIPRRRLAAWLLAWPILAGIGCWLLW